MTTEPTHERELWTAWAERLRQWGLDGFAGALLESAGPFNLLAAQCLYIGQPVLAGLPAAEQISALASLLEDKMQTQDFVRLLREGDA